MKKIILLAVLLIAVFSLAQSQASLPTSTSQQLLSSSLTPDNLYQVNDVIYIPSWSPWIDGTDSTNKKYSRAFDISKYDSINCWVMNSTTRGVADVKTVLLVGFKMGTPVSPSVNFNTNDTTRVLCDTTTSKNTVLSYYGTGVATNGAQMGKLALTPTVSTGAPATYANHSNDILNYILICHRRIK